WI
ncbi:hypothetical protein D030_4895B, partial [Vibrio parahaemolyticus AQ3810]